MRNHLRDAINALRIRELAVARVPQFLIDGWTLCAGCGQSSTGSYMGHQCCTRCQQVVT